MKIITFVFNPTHVNPVCWCGDSFSHTHEENPQITFQLDHVNPWLEDSESE